MAKIKLDVELSIGLVATRQDTITVDITDDATEQEKEELLESAAQEWANNFIDISFEESED